MDRVCHKRHSRLRSQRCHTAGRAYPWPSCRLSTKNRCLWGRYRLDATARMDAPIRNTEPCGSLDLRYCSVIFCGKPVNFRDIPSAGNRLLRNGGWTGVLPQEPEFACSFSKRVSVTKRPQHIVCSRRRWIRGWRTDDGRCSTGGTSIPKAAVGVAHARGS